MDATVMRRNGQLRQLIHIHAAQAAWARNKSLRASDIIMGALAAMVVVLGLAYVSTLLLSATADPAARETELLEPLK